MNLPEKIGIVLAWYCLCGAVCAGTSMIPGVLIDRRTGRTRRQTWPMVALIFALWWVFWSWWTLNSFRDRRWVRR